MTILLTGIGPVSSIGIGREAFVRGLASGQCGITPLSLFAGAHPAAEVQGLRIETILPSVKTYLDRASEFTLAACQLALNDAQVALNDTQLARERPASTTHVERWRAGVVMGSEFGCLGTMQTYTHALQQKGARLANPLLFSHMYVNTPASLAAIEFGFGGHHGAYAGAGAGAQALAGAWEALQLNRADMLLVIGVDVLSEPLYRALVAEGTLGADAIGEGACALVLETADHAGLRGVTGIPLETTTADGAFLRPRLGHTFAAEPVFALASHALKAALTMR